MSKKRQSRLATWFPAVVVVLGGMVGFIVVALFALALRGGVIALLVALAHFPPQLAVLAGVAAAADSGIIDRDADVVAMSRCGQT